MKLLRRLRYVIAASLLTSVALAADSGSQSLDSVLDRLERKLMEQEASSLRIEAPKPSSSPAPSQTIRLKPQGVEASMPGTSDFQSLEKQIATLEKEADELSGQIEGFKSDLLGKALQGNLVEIEAQIEDPDLTSLREMNITLDGVRIYSMDSGEWSPNARVPFFIGPLEAGEHTVQLEARTARRREKTLPIDQNIFHRYDQSFTLKVPEGAFRKGFRLKLSKPEAQNARAVASLEVYDLP